MDLEILHDSGGVLAVAKPAGLPTQAPPGIPSVESLIRARLFGAAAAAAIAAGRRRHPGGYLGVPHRLDRAVSGVLLLATTPRAARTLSRQFERREIAKTYLAVVAAASGSPVDADTFEWHDTIRKVPDEPRVELVPAGGDGGREAVTTGRVRGAAGGTLLLELSPRTGRMHQLRVQTAARGLPVLGDATYGGPPLIPAADHACSRSIPIALHAWRIAFSDPEFGQPTEIVCPPPVGPPWDRYAIA
jgi:23S rRNA pseudouridine1911/1915/1917 synthase